MRKHPRRWAAIAGALGLALASASSIGGARAQGRPPPPPPPPPWRRVPPPAPEPKLGVREGGDLLGRFGVTVAERLLAASDAEGKLRAIRRLAEIGTPQAIDALVRAEEPGGAAARDVRARLEGVRGLAPHLAQDGPRQVVLRALVEGGGEGDPELGGFLRETAALVLARDGGEKGTEALVGLVRQGGPAGAAAGKALAAYPPVTLESALGAKAPVSLPMVELIARLGDLRGLPLLRAAVRQGDPQTRARSLEVMAELGDGEAGLIAKEWAAVDDPLPRVAAARALARTSPAEAREAIARLLADDRTRDEGLDLAASAPSPGLAKALSPLLASAAPDVRRRAIVALGRAGGRDAADALSPLLGRDDAAHEAGLALALSPGSEARAALSQALGDPARRAAAIRASAIRAIALRDAVPGLGDAAREAFASGGAGRAAAAFAWVVTGERRADDPEFLGDPSLVAAASRASLAAGAASHATEGLLVALAKAGDDRAQRDALGVALLGRVDGGGVPTASLLAWAEEGGAIAPLAARALGARDDEATRTRLAALLASGDPQLRSHAALGLGRSPEADAAGRLSSAYAFEPDARVRRAIVRALSRRTEPARRATLELAAAYDPDSAARSAARAALRGRVSPDASAGELVGWAQVVSSFEPGARGRASFRWERPDGLVLPVVADADGALLVPGLPAGSSRVSFAPAPAAPPVPAAPAASAASTGSAVPAASAAPASSSPPPAPAPSASSPTAPRGP